MKKVISVSMVIAMILVLSACSSVEYTDTPVTVAVTDENGEAVTDKDGNAVTEVVTDENGETKTETKKNTTSKSGGKATAAKNDNQNDDSNNGSSGNTGNNNSGNNNNNQGGSGSGDDNTPTNTTKPTEKPKKRDITVTVNLPYYNSKKTELTLFYKVDGDKEPTALEPVELVLDGKGDNKKQEFIIEDVKGEVYVYIQLKDITITHNDITIPASGEGSDSGTITPVTGIEIMDGGMD